MRTPRALVAAALAGLLLVATTGPSTAQDEPDDAPATQLRVAR